MQNKDERTHERAGRGGDDGAGGFSAAADTLFKASYLGESGRLPMKSRASASGGNGPATANTDRPDAVCSVKTVASMPSITRGPVLPVLPSAPLTSNSRRRARRSRSLPTNVYGHPSDGVKVSKISTQRPHSHHGRSTKSSAAVIGAAASVAAAAAAGGGGAGVRTSVLRLGGLAVTAGTAELPPVNLESLREIDLTEIFKNPQLRHDIVFDAQLQFRPNMDGERGKRKRAVADRYWDAVADECAQIGMPGVSPRLRAGRLPLLFSTLREILVSLLPTRNRDQMDAVLDTELLMQQLEHCALDFVNFAEWLATVFKTHCAPMRDCWVDQMVARFKLGVETGSHLRLVEGLRMSFAILEAMKLDVANHQIRTLRPMLVDSAIEFEQEYYNQVLLKGRANFTDALKWYEESGRKFAAADKQVPAACGPDRASFVWGLLQLITCASDDKVSVTSGDFPSTFGFDYGRLSNLRAELRRIVCLQLVVMLYQQMLHSELQACGGRATGASTSLGELKQVVLAIVSDSVGNAKWTRSIPALSLELAKRVSATVHGATDDLPDSRLVDLALGWLTKQLQPKSPLYHITEKRIVDSLYEAAANAAAIPSPLDGAVLADGVAPSTLKKEAPTFDEMTSLVDRLLVVVRFHWGVFGRYYNGANQRQPASGVLATAGLALLVESDNGGMAPTGGRMRQPSTC